MTTEPADDVDEDEPVGDADEQPELDDDEMADISSVAAEIEEETSAGDGDDREESDDGDGQEDSSDGELDSPTSLTDGDRTTPGDIYCNGLGMLAAVGRTQYGSADESQRKDLMTEYGDIARDLEIDQYVDQLLEEQGGIDELSPAQALLATTMMWGGMVAMDDPEMLEGIRGGVDA